MGILKSSFNFLLGTVVGVYLAQNYNLPDVKKLANTAFLFSKHIEENYRKPNNRPDHDRDHDDS